MEGRVCFCSASPPSSHPSSPCSRNGRNFKRKFTNEGDFPRTPLRRFPGRKRRRQGEEEVEEAVKRKIARRFSAAVFRASSSTRGPRLSRSCVSFFFFSPQLVHASELPAAKNEIPRSRQKFTFPRAARS